MPNVNRHVPILVIGATTGGVAAALAACRMGVSAALCSEHPWIGGQLTAQAVPPDENRWIETVGASATYQQYRQAVRAWYRAHRCLSPEAKSNPHFNPGGGWVSRLCHEPAIGDTVLREMLQPYVSTGQLSLYEEVTPTGADVDREQVRAVTLFDRTGNAFTITADFVLDATDTGVLLPLCGVEHRIGAESQSEFDEPHAPTTAHPDATQSITWCLAAGYDPNGDYTIGKPPQYDVWTSLRPAGWRGPLASWTTWNHNGEPEEWTLLEDGPGGYYRSFFAYRRIVCRSITPDAPEDVTIVNWPHNDCDAGSLLGSPEERRTAEYTAKWMSWCTLYWLQTEAPRPDGGAGWPGLHPRPDITGTADGLAQAPYVRESRRVVALHTVCEQHVALAAREGARLEPVHDSVGIGHYTIDIHPRRGLPALSIPTAPFQIPLRSLVPVRLRNILPACKNGGWSHIASGCLRLHPIEWNVGESAGALAAFCLTTGMTPQQVAVSETAIHDLQQALIRLGVRLRWEIDE